MLSLRSFAFILASAIRRARALSCAALPRSPARMRRNGRKLARSWRLGLVLDGDRSSSCRLEGTLFRGGFVNRFLAAILVSTTAAAFASELPSKSYLDLANIKVMVAAAEAKA